MERILISYFEESCFPNARTLISYRKILILQYNTTQSTIWVGNIPRCDFVLKLTNFVLEMMDFVFKRMNFVLKMMNCVLKMMNFEFKMMKFVF